MARFRSDSGSTLPSVWSDFFDGDGLFGNRWSGQGAERPVPAVNIRENDNEFDLEFAAPGFAKDDFKIHLDDNVLTISAEHRNESQTDGNDRFTRREFSYSSFARSFTLPQHVDPDRIDAKYTDGILKVCIPKKEEAKALPRKEIKVN